jgi:hypothetical protein
MNIERKPFTMKRLSILALLAMLSARHVACIAVAMLCFMAPCAMLLFAVEPQSCTMTNSRTDSLDAFVADIQYYRNTSFLFTNCVVQGSSGSAENLTNTTISIYVGDSTSTSNYTGSVQTATTGTWCASFTIPTNWTRPNIWIKLTDTATNSYIYPRKILKTIAAP